MRRSMGFRWCSRPWLSAASSTDSAISVVATAPGTLPAGVWSAVGAVFLAAFIFRQISLQTKGHPLLDLRTFESRNFTVSVLLMASMMMALFGTIILLPIYLQNVLGLSTLQTGLLLLPGGLLMGLLGPHVGRLYDKAGPIRLWFPESSSSAPCCGR